MEIKKYKHTTYLVCINRKKLLINPGIFSFKSKNINDFKELDSILISHLHADHFDENFVKEIYDSVKPKIFAQEDVSKRLKSIGIDSETIYYGKDPVFLETSKSLLQEQLINNVQ